MTSCSARVSGPSPRARGKRSRPSLPLRRASVHPRVRGENAHAEPAECLRHRSIPACAGKTPPPSPFPSLPFGPSPRARGKRLEPVTTDGLKDGPSPRARGKRHDAATVASRKAVHPRVRGENSLSLFLSSPPSRSIPACAGKTLLWLRFSWVVPVHPRVRGENGQRVSHSPADLGPSPRARGKLLPLLLSLLPLRSIPACAGKTPLGGLAPGPCCRSIPACAGKTSACGPGLLAMTVHPRVRGENG